MIFKCKICGGDVEVAENRRTITCEYCGSKQVLPKQYDEKKKQLCDRANHFRVNNEFDKAIAMYETILLDDPLDGDIYWQLLLCEYGVVYVKDKKTESYIPTCNRTKTISVLANENYKNALKYSTEEQKEIYQQEAKKIDYIQKNTLAIANQEQPYDIFICYKETDENGTRTQDSVLAQDIYQHFTNQGYKVFFSKITLENKLGSEYEPYIFAALNSAKVMIVLGTQKEYFEAPWVKNEWSRYLGLMKEDQKKILIPAYKDMNPYDIPEEFAHLQAVDLGRIGAITDLQSKFVGISASQKMQKTKSVEEQKRDLSSKKKRRKKIIIAISIITVILIGIALTPTVIIPEMHYQEAKKLMEEEKYKEAFVAFEVLGAYRDSEAKLSECNQKWREKREKELKKYVGTYDKTEEGKNMIGDVVPVGATLTIKSVNATSMELEMYNTSTIKVALILGKAQVKGTNYEFTSNDGWGHTVKGVIELLEDGVKVTLVYTNEEDEWAEWGIGEGTTEFKFSDMKKEQI